MIFALLSCGGPAAESADENAKLTLGASESDSKLSSKSGARKAGEQAGGPSKQLSEDELISRYQAAKQAFVQIPVEASLQDSSALQPIESDLMLVATQAKDPHLRANANLFLGRIAEEKRDPRGAVSFYQAAVAATPKEPEPHAVLALSLAATGRFEDAIAEQKKLISLVPDDLLARMVLGELQVKAGNKEEATRAYAEYEVRRKGLIDGLTLRKDGKFVAGVQERIACVHALEPAVDNGTAMALLAALTTEPDTQVKTAIAEVMGRQGLLGYQETLRDMLAKEQGAELKATYSDALKKIQLARVETKPGQAPKMLDAMQAGSADAQGEANTQNEKKKPDALVETPKK